VSQIDLKELEQRPFPGSLAAEYRVVISGEAFEAIKKHALSDTSVELCGVLAGSLLKDEDGPYLLVDRAIAGAATRRTGSQVTFTHETWERIHKQLEAEAPDLRIVGWYHTHPGFGVFLSEMDQFIQDNFFDMPHNVAFVYDPNSRQRGLYIWRDGRSSRLRRYWLGGKLVYDFDAESPPGGKPEKPEPAERQRERTEYVRVHEPEPTGMWIKLVAVVVLLFAAFWLGGHAARTSAEQSSQLAKMLDTTLQFQLFRDGLDAALKQMAGQLRLAHARLQQVQAELARRPAPKEGGATQQDAADKAMEEALTLVGDAHRALGQVEQAYTGAGVLTKRVERAAALPEEMVRVQGIVANLAVLQAKLLLADPSKQTAESRRQLAEQLRQLLITFLPQAKDQIDRQLPELAPKGEQPPEPKGESPTK